MKKTKIYIAIIITLISLIGCVKQEKNMNNDEIEKSIDDFLNRKKYTNIDKATLEKIADEYLVQAISDYVSEQIIGEDWKNEYQKVKDSPIGFQYIYAIGLLEGEVNNGGFNQYFFNSSRQFVDEAYNGLIAIGANKTAEILKNAIATFMEEKDMQLKMRKKGTIEAFSESYEETELGKWDDEFYKYQEDLQVLQINYIRKNYKDFVR